MIDRAHIRNGEIIKKFIGEKGWITLADGSKVSPVTIGFESGDDKVVPVEFVTVDNSTSEKTFKDKKTTVESGRVLITTTIRDKTKKENDKEAKGNILALGRRIDDDALFSAVSKALFAMASNDVPPKAKKDIVAFKTWIKELIT